VVRDKFYIIKLEDGKLSWRYHVGGPMKLSTNTKISPNTWYHVAMVRNGMKTARVYINRNEMGRVTRDFHTTPTTLFEINYAAGTVNGAIDDLLIASRAFSQTEIIRVMEQDVRMNKSYGN